MKTLIIGASRGIGRATAHELSRRGHALALGYHSNDDAATELAGDLGATPTVLVRGDVATDGPRMVADAVAGLGGLDNIVVTAVPIITGPVAQVSSADAQRAMDVVVNGFRDVAIAARPHLAGGGSMVAVSSLGSDRYASYYGALGPAKAALEGLVRYLAAELGPDLIRVNAVSPCLVDDPGHFVDAPEVTRFLDAAARRTPLGRRLATPSDIAPTIAALIGDDFNFVTGQIVKVDGGYSLMA